MNLAESFNQVSAGLLQFGQACEAVTAALRAFGVVIESHREEWTITLQGQWPDEFTLLNRYVRTGLRPPFIFND